jgi:hypothetical protein
MITEFDPSTSIAFELHFQSLHRPGDACAFPCSQAGSVDLDALSERARVSYFYARSTIGRDFARPEISPRLQ